MLRDFTAKNKPNSCFTMIHTSQSRECGSGQKAIWMDQRKFKVWLSNPAAENCRKCWSPSTSAAHDPSDLVNYPISKSYASGEKIECVFRTRKMCASNDYAIGFPPEKRPGRRSSQTPAQGISMNVLSQSLPGPAQMISIGRSINQDTVSHLRFGCE